MSQSPHLYRTDRAVESTLLAASSPGVGAVEYCCDILRVGVARDRGGGLVVDVWWEGGRRVLVRGKVRR